MEGYLGDVTSAEAWKILSSDPDAVLVDVRTKAEWIFVGIPDLGRIGKRSLFIEWQRYPDMRPNPEFVDQLKSHSVDTPMLFLCRSGVRSRAAAIAMTQQGFSRCYNVCDGFEGNLDGDKHRATAESWKSAGLPWVQG